MKKGISDLEKEHFLRLRARWVGNDDRRESELKNPLTEDEVNNIESLAVLMDIENPNDRLMKAEIMRELGQFKEASLLLKWQFEEDYFRAVEIIRDLVEKEDKYVVEMIIN